MIQVLKVVQKVEEKQNLIDPQSTESVGVAYVNLSVERMNLMYIDDGEV